MIDSSLIYLQNRRMDAIAKNLGTDSPIYQREANKMRESLPPEFTREVNGVLHMYGTNKMQAAGVTYSDIPRIKEWRQVKDAYKEGYKDYKRDVDADISLKDYVGMQSNLEEDIPLLYGKSEKAQEGLEIMQQRTKSWSDIQRVRDIQKELKR